jgi:LysR family transcriptional regulator, hydrogen peroxide-inducible genes activator
MALITVWIDLLRFDVMTLTQLRFIVAVANTLSFRKAADSCFVSQPSLSVGVKNLEESLGVVIFDRNKNGKVTITPIGSELVAQARFVLTQAKVLQEIAKKGAMASQNALQSDCVRAIGSVNAAALH